MERQRSFAAEPQKHGRQEWRPCFFFSHEVTTKMPRNVACRIWWDQAIMAYRISTPYSQEFIEALKATVPSSDRAFDSATKIWTFSEKYFDFVTKLANMVWKNPGEVVIITRAQAQQATSPSVVAKATLDSVLVQFMKLLPPSAATAAYRKAAFELHPDRGGDMEKMS